MYMCVCDMSLRFSEPRSSRGRLSGGPPVWGYHPLKIRTLPGSCTK